MIFAKQIEKQFRKRLYVRHDETGLTYYFSHADFPDLKMTPYEFTSPLGHILKGYFYTYGKHNPQRLVVFDHGMGVGHRAYMKEIELLCRRGYGVFTYDHTGCATSGGEHIHGFAQSLQDLDTCIRFLKEEPAFSGARIAVMGHSWGGFSTLNIAKYHPDITHVVAISGFISVWQMIRQVTKGFLSLYRRGLYAFEQQGKLPYALDDARETLANTEAKALIIHSMDDPVVDAAYHFTPLKQALAGKENIRFLSVDGKKHSPNYTMDAVTYKDAYFDALKQGLRNKQFDTQETRDAFRTSYDWERMTQQDMDVWEEIFTFLES